LLCTRLGPGDHPFQLRRQRRQLWLRRDGVHVLSDRLYLDSSREGAAPVPKDSEPACPKGQLEDRAARRYVPAMTRSGPGGQREGQPSSDEAPLVAIVDDDASVRQSARRLIRSFGYRAEAFASGEECLASASAARTACLV